LFLQQKEKKMKEFLPIISKSKLFTNVTESEILEMMKCLHAVKKNYTKDEKVLRQGEHVDKIMLLVKGKLLIQQDDFWGNRNILNIVTPAQLFGESYLAPNSCSILNDVIAQENSVVIFFDAKRVITVCSSACKFHSLVVKNLFHAISEKNNNLVQKINYLSKRTTREKLLAYLSDEAQKYGNSNFEIPFNRQQLADFLCVDRSAMSNELCKMQKEGLLTFQKNQFSLTSQTE